ncbi:MAG: hypothetical protein JKY61_02170 [Planctomycetes bacterium]|nr:hypothetical protein [Planctomycetota bacterium]
MSLKFTQDSNDTDAPGNISGYSTTDKHGRFLVKGLQPGSYKVQRESRDVTQAIRDLLDPLRFQADGEDIRLTIPRFHLEVSLLASSGGAWSAGPIYAGELFSPNMRKRFDETKWPEDPTLVVVDAGHERDAGLADRRRLRGSTHADDRYTFELQAGHSYWVGVLGGDFSVHFEKITVTEDKAHYKVQLTPVEAQGFGRIRVGTRETPRGRSSWLSTSDTTLWIESPTGGVRLLNTRYLAYSLDSKLPVGRYRIVGHGTPGALGCGNSPHVHRKLGFEESIVEIRKGEIALVGLGLKQGALLKATVISSGYVRVPSHEREALYWIFSPAPPTEPYAAIHLEHSARRSEYVLHYAKEGHPFRSPTRYWPLNQTLSSERLPYGDYTLVITRCDGKVERRPVQLRSGETTEITVEFAGQ